MTEPAAEMGRYFERALTSALGQHPQVGDIRGWGMFRAPEFVADSESKSSF